MKAFITGAILILSAACANAGGRDNYWYVNIGASVNTSLFNKDKSVAWENRGTFGCSFGAGHRHKLQANWYGDVGYKHNSQCLVGPPFDDQSESTLDSLGYNLEYRFY